MEQPPARNIRLRLSSNPESYRAVDSNHESYRAVEIVDVGEYASSTLASTRRSRLGVRSKVALGIHNPCAGEGEKLKGYNWDTSQEHWADKTRAEDTKYRRGKINEAKKTTNTVEQGWKWVHVKSQGLIALLVVGDTGIKIAMCVNDATWVISEGVSRIYGKVVDTSVQSVVNSTDRGENEARIRPRNSTRRI